MLLTHRKIIIVFTVLTVLYVILCLSGVAGTTAAFGGMVQDIITVCVLLVVCVRVFKGTSKAAGGSFFAGAFGLGTFAVNEVYSFFYLYIFRGNEADITVAHFNRNCAFLFFIAALLLLLRGDEKLISAIKYGVGSVSSITAVVIFYAVLIDNPDLLYYPALVNLLLCTALTVYVFFQAPRGNVVRAFACSIAAVYLLESAHRLMIIYPVSPLWHDIAVSLYPLAYIFFGLTLLRLGEGGESSG
jgi:hypothetical protein